jgi:aryl-alcohol dehydrogenase-like predicted oxidoreductase
MTDMRFRRLGNSGLVVSVVGLGTNNFGMKISPDEAKPVVDACFDAGITLFDTADVYGASEDVLGALLQGRRDDVIIATKFGSSMVGRGAASNGADWDARGSRRYIRKAVTTSLRRLKTDWIDLYQIHRPDPLTPIEETLGALDELVTEGKIRYFGHSNFSGFQTAHAEWTARTRGTGRFISAQNEYSLLKRTKVETDLAPALQEYGIGLLPFFPLASGLLTGKYRRGEAPPQGSRIQAWKREAVLTDPTFDVIEKLESFAAERSVTLLDIAMGGLAAMPTVSSVIAGATTAEQVRANAAAGAWVPTAADLDTIKELTA